MDQMERLRVAVLIELDQFQPLFDQWAAVGAGDAPGDDAAAFEFQVYVFDILGFVAREARLPIETDRPAPIRPAPLIRVQSWPLPATE
jgi:hypothetical protein